MIDIAVNRPQHEEEELLRRFNEYVNTVLEDKVNLSQIKLVRKYDYKDNQIVVEYDDFEIQFLASDFSKIGYFFY